MRINVLSTGRFHVCDLARELATQGHDVKFYSHVPKSRTNQFGLPEICARPVLIWVIVPLIINRIFAKTKFVDATKSLLFWWIDFIVSIQMEPCDVVIAMSGCFNQCVGLAKKRWKSIIIIERGSRHILSQKEILDEVRKINPKANTVSAGDVHRELRDYENADYIAVASQHVSESFVDKGISKNKLFVNPYGVDLKMFKPTNAPRNEPTICMIGTWSIRKGCDLLVEAIKGLEYKVIHAGVIEDCLFPNNKQYTSYGFVDQTKLIEVYSQAHLLVLPSREEGLALVQVQALACGLNIVCSDRTGGADLRGMLDDKDMIAVVKAGSVVELREAIIKSMNMALNKEGLRNRSKTILNEQFSWKAYGNRYNQFLEGLFNKNIERKK